MATWVAAEARDLDAGERDRYAVSAPQAVSELGGVCPSLTWGHHFCSSQLH